MPDKKYMESTFYEERDLLLQDDEENGNKLGDPAARKYSLEYVNLVMQKGHSLLFEKKGPYYSFFSNFLALFRKASLN